MISSRKACFLITVTLSFIFPLDSYGFKGPTHRSMNEHIVVNSFRIGEFNEFCLDSYLKNELSVQKGIDFDLAGKILMKLILDGGETEDEPFTRSANHFHNPLTDEGFNGIWGIFFDGDSSIQWLQRPESSQEQGGSYSWIDVRKYFYCGLTAIDRSTEENNFAKTFRGIGQLLHLIQDLAVPEHTRDDFHMTGFEQWADGENSVTKTPNLVLSDLEPVYFDLLSIGQSNVLSDIPVANLFDTNQYTLSNLDPAVTLGQSIGLSEYTNANFMSSDTMFSPEYPHPAYQNCELYTDTTNNRIYLKSKGPGEQVDHLALAGLLLVERQKRGIEADGNWPVGLDDACYEEYASFLIPRAIGYSAGLLYYFFRGKLNVSSTEPVYSNGDVSALRLRIKNETGDQETMSNGSFVLVCRYTPEGGNEDGSDDIFIESSEVTCNELQSDEEGEFIFEFPDGDIPIDRYGTVECTLAYKGNLGNESDAVVGKVFQPGPRFEEEWDNGLDGNYAWVQNTGGGDAILEINNEILTMDNIRQSGRSNACVNEIYLDMKNEESPDGFPIGPKTALQFKVDELSINAIPPAPPGHTAQWQIIQFGFSDGYFLEISQPGQFLLYGSKTAYCEFDLGADAEANIYDLFQSAEIPPPERLYIESISIYQQLWDLSQPSEEVHHQHMEVDYLRLVDKE